ncbi:MULTISPECIES: hypothetical protein [unclassified Erythrobacter]|uniref:hypothetical protein n=1 Tax=unclassified Erythrobacter TaxID=2633097 RepID=UPI0007B9E028|nr:MULTISPECIES: hypothetical protein [unclassified Erythrobacter]KZY94338.1 hypothetical protein A3745_11110 [Erythrobacter sp. HI0074]KZZ09089.1 hypothetical protein A3748_09405 [Erythrobacter sp. HI0077]
MKAIFRPLRYLSASFGLLVMAILLVLSFVGTADDLRSASDPKWWEALMADLLSLPALGQKVDAFGERIKESEVAVNKACEYAATLRSDNLDEREKMDGHFQDLEGRVNFLAEEIATTASGMRAVVENTESKAYDLTQTRRELMDRMNEIERKK